MKKILSLTLALAMIGTILTGCGSKDAATKTPAENTQQEQTQTEKALALINTFATGNTDTARSLLADGYIQHNLASSDFQEPSAESGNPSTLNAGHHFLL